jgi:hypothetical protein
MTPALSYDVRVVITRLFLLLCVPLAAAGWADLLKRDPSLSGWQKVGPGLWHVTSDGVLVGQRDPSMPRTGTGPDQAWLYTKREYDEFDLRFEFWNRLRGNSGVSVRDTSRARYSFGSESDPDRTPSHIGYEIQILNAHTDKFPTGSLYLFQPAKAGIQLDHDWNQMVIECRRTGIRVRLNGQLVMEHAGDAARNRNLAPIGLQLHDRNSVIMFRNIQVREVK